MKYTAYALVWGLALGAPFAFSMQGASYFKAGQHLSGVKKFQKSGKNPLEIHPFMAKENLPSDLHSLALFSPSIEDTVKGALKKIGVSINGIHKKNKSTRVTKMQHSAGDLCQNNGDMVLTGDYIRTSFRPSEAAVEQGYLGLAQTQPLSASEALDKLYAIVPGADKIAVADPCLSLEDEQLSWTTEVSFVDPRIRLPMLARVRADSEVEIVDQSFSVDGKVEAYVRNPDEGVTDTYDYSDFSANSDHMDSPFFVTDVSTGSRASEPDRNYSGYDQNSDEFEEANAFAHVREAFSSYVDKGFNFYGAAPLTISVRNVFGVSDNPNNAVFIPGEATESGLPMIRLGSGDGRDLQNLGLDVDVVAHELGHFVIFETLKQATRGSEALTIHEGGADFLAFAHSGDACLGESTCAENSTTCAQSGCLRSGENSYRIDDGTFSSDESHLLGQVISGALWDLTDVHGIARDTVTELFIDALDLLVFDSGYRDLFLALFTADRNNFDGEHAEEICAVSSARGFDSFLTDVNCPNPTAIPSIEGLGTGLTETSRVFAESNSSGGCGVVGGQGHGSQIPVALLLLGLAPMLLYRPKRRS